MEPDVSVESAATIRVVIMPVGEVSSSVFRDYSSLIMRQQKVELNNVISFYKEVQKSPFSHQPWDTGYLHFKFVLGGATRSPWEDFQAQRKIHGVIGILHCPHFPDLGEAYEDFMQACKAYPSAQAKRCFAFDPNDAQVEQDDKKRKNLILFPWANPQKLDFFMATIMQDFAATMLMAFESWVLHADPLGAILSTPLDTQASLSSEEAKKRRLGRIQKSIGDYCMLAGSPQDAHEHFKSAIELAKLSNDLFWHAGALEGITSAIVMDTPYKSEVLEQVMRERYHELVYLYRRVPAPIFELEAIVKKARYLCRKELAKEVVDLLSGAVEAAKLLTNPNDKLVLYTEVAKIFSQLGYERKAAFFARQVAQMYQQQDSRFAACSSLQILNLTAPLYKVQSRNATMAAAPSSVASPNSQQQKAAGTQKPVVPGQHGASEEAGQWPTLQMDVLGDMLSTAVRAGEPLLAWSASARLLRGHYPLITPSGQYALAAALTASAARLAPGTRTSDPVLPFIRVHGFPGIAGASQIVKRNPGRKDWWNGPAGSGPFIYTPFSGRGGQEKEKTETVWAVGEMAQVYLELANPCAFEVTVESIFLSITPGFEAFPLSLSLAPNTPSHIITLAGVPRVAGPAKIRGCFVKCFGVLVEHLFDEVLEVSSAAKGMVLADPFRGRKLPKKREPPALSIHVLPPLPLLVAQLGEGEGAPVLFEGEVRDIYVKLTNAGAVDVTSGNLSLIGKQRDHVVSIGQEVFQKALPLPPGASVTVPVRLKAQFSSAEKGDAGLRRGLSTGLGASMREDVTAELAVHYAGAEESGAEPEQGEPAANGEAAAGARGLAPPGRRLALPLHLHVQKGLYVVKARLLAMGGPSGASSRSDVAPLRKLERPLSLGPRDVEEAAVPIREGKGLRLLELELWNGTDVVFEVTASIQAVDVRGPEGWKRVPSGDVGAAEAEEPSLRKTRIDRECSARVLIPLEAFRAGAEAGPPPPGPLTSHRREDSVGGGAVEKEGGKQFVLPRNAEEAKEAAQYEAAVEALCSGLAVRWHSGRNSRGELPIRDEVREALRGPAMEILLPDLVTFSFSHRPVAGVDPAAQGSRFPGRASSLARSESATEGGAVVARELTSVTLAVRNNSDRAMAMSLSVTCRDVTGASCMGAAGGKATVLWSGCLNGVSVEVPAWGEAVHEFVLCFLVPGEYTLLAVAVVEDYEPGGLEAQILDSTAPQRVCCSGLPHKVFVSARYSAADLGLLLDE